jgi:hypothetical protein
LHDNIFLEKIILNTKEGPMDPNDDILTDETSDDKEEEIVEVEDTDEEGDDNVMEEV